MKKTFILVIILAAIVVIGLALVNWNQNNKAWTTETKEMIALGDSLTDGVGDKSGDGFVENIETHLKETKNTIITVLNYGIPGQQTDGLLEQVKQNKLKLSLRNADYITLFIGTNDLVQSNGGDLKEINMEKIAAAQEDYEQNLKEILEIIRKENKDAPILFLGLYNPYPDSQEIEDIIVNWNANSQQIVDEYENIKFISTNDIFPKKSTEYFSDSLHPNKKGYDLITDKIIEEYDF